MRNRSILFVAVLLAACSNRVGTGGTGSEGSAQQTEKSRMESVANDLVPAMYDFRTNPNVDAYKLAQYLLSSSNNCVGHFEGNYVKYFVRFDPTKKSGTASEYTMAGDRSLRPLKVELANGGTDVSLVGDIEQLFPVGTSASDKGLFSLTALFKDKSGDIVLYGSNDITLASNIMPSRNVELFCGDGMPKSDQWRQEIDRWTRDVTVLQNKNLPYI
ncbi:hypothetical protein [Sphingomonas oryzagri]